MRIVRIFGLISLCSVATIAAGCGGDDGDGKSQGAAKNSALNGCSTGQCDQKEVEAYGECVSDACDAEYKECFGDGYKTGSYADSPCADYYTCLGKCSCGDSACMQKCGVAPDDCQLCIANKITYCVSKSSCTAPSCTQGPGELGTCDDLAACCATITDSTYKTLCNTELNGAASQGGDIICNSFVKAFQAMNMCK